MLCQRYFNVSCPETVVRQATMGQLGEWARVKSAMKKAVRSVRSRGCEVHNRVS